MSTISIQIPESLKLNIERLAKDEAVLAKVPGDVAVEEWDKIP